MIFQTISTWKTLSINVVYNPDKKEIPYTDEECRILSIFKQDYGDDTCWANTVINAFLISRNMQKIAITYLQTYMNDVVNRLSIEKQEVFYNPDRICILPKKLMSDTAERFSIMQFVYKSLCYFSKTIHERNTDPSLKWNMHVARTFNDTERSFVSKLLRLLPGEVGIVAWAIRGFLQNIYGRELYPTKVMTDVSYKKIITGQVHINPDVEIILTDVVRDFPMEEKVVFNDEVFWLDHVALFLYEIGKFHYMTGVFCNNEPYIIDTNDFNGIYKADWVNGNFWEIKQRYKTNKIRVSYACYIKEISYDTEPNIDCLKNASVGKRIVRERIVKEQLAQLPPIRWSSRRV
jgi:hypothetical protein